MRLLVTCGERPGIVASITRFLTVAGANLVCCDQHSSDPADGTLFLRAEFTIDRDACTGLAERFRAEVGDRYAMSWRIADAARPQRVAVLVSRYDHCLHDLLWRWRRGELGAEIVLVASNHRDAQGLAEAAGLPFFHIPADPERKADVEARLLELLGGACDLVVLARYMQILSPAFLEQVGVPVINIHHSFLPAFAGAGPYEQARRRGVKLIGATAHYVTEELDAGPIIEQDVARVTHRDAVATLTRRGAEIERTVLARAVRWHCQDRILRHKGTTVVF
jgi:formyltetrahydrofolate deformylase